MLIDIAFFTLLGVGDDASGYGSGNLAHEDILTLGGGDHHVGVLVLLTGFRQPGLVVVAVLMNDELHLSIDGEPVGMHVPGTHKDGDHQSLVVEILMFIHFLDDHDAAVGRSHHHFRGVAVEVADRTAVEVQGNEPHRAEDDDEDPERNDRVDEMEEQPGNNHQGDGTQSEFLCPFAVNPDLFQFIDPFSHSFR